MAKMESFLSRLFGAKERPEEPEERQEEPHPEAERPPEPPPPDPALLLLPPEHAIYKLWDLRTEEAGPLLPPELRLSAPEGEPEAISAEAAKQELIRLQVAVTSAANKRLAKTVPKGKDRNKARKQDAAEDEPPTRPDLDAEVQVFVSTDRMAAWILAYPPVGEGRELDEDLISQALEAAKVRYGLEEARLDAMPERSDRYFRLLLAARGVPAIHGKDGYVVDLFPRTVQREFVIDEYNRVDYTNLNLVQNVEEGAVICRIIPPTLGEPGRSVLDAELAAKDGRAATPPKGKYVELSEDGSKLIAGRAGHVEFVNGVFQIKPLLEIGGNVDYSTGNLKFLGDIHVHGDVCSGFSIKAMGNITVDGVVESSYVEAGGDVVVVKGVQGDGEAVIRANRSVYAKFLESCYVHAKEGIQADCIINCEVYCDGQVQVCSGRGTVIGGKICAAKEVSASIVGSRSEVPTVVTLGGLPCEEYDQEVLVQEIDNFEAELERTEKEPDSPSKLSRMSKLRMKLSVNRNRLEQMKKDLAQQEDQEEGRDARRLVCGIAYSGTEITIGGVTHRLTREIQPCTAMLSEGEICFL